MGGQTPAIAARERSGEAEAAEPKLASLLLLLPLESLLVRQCLERLRRPLGAAEGEVVILPALEEVVGRTKEAEEVVLAVTTAQQRTGAVVLGR